MQQSAGYQASPCWPEVRVIRDEAERVAKYVFTRPDAVAEAVLYRYPDYRTRTVICCSTQAGCPVGCRFCGAGDSFVRSLTADEIVAQVERTLEDVDCPPSEMGRLQIMFMSMGEPLLNLAGLVPALHRLHALYPAAALLVSTSAPRISPRQWEELLAACVAIPTVGLQFSVHESTDAARDLLIPFKGKMTIAEMAVAGGEFLSATGRHPFFNYCAHDANSSEPDADRILASFDPLVFRATVSVTCERSDGLPATNDHQRSLATGFGDLLLGRGFDVRVFDPAGQDTIGGGCGQLWFVQKWLDEHPGATRRSVGAGLPVRHAPVAA